MEFLGLTALGLCCLAPFAFLEMRYGKTDEPILTLVLGFLIYLTSDFASFESLPGFFGVAFMYLPLGPMVLGEMALEFIRGAV